MCSRHLSRSIEAEDARKAGLVKPVLARENRSYARVYRTGFRIWVGWRRVYGFCMHQDARNVCQTVLGAGLVAPEVEIWKYFANALARSGRRRGGHDYKQGGGEGKDGWIRKPGDFASG